MTGTSKSWDWGGITPTVNQVEFGVSASGKVGTGYAYGPNSSGQFPLKRVVYNITANDTKTLTAADSGAMVALNKASGTIVTLPAASPGLWFDFGTVLSVTSNAYKVITSAGTEFIFGQLLSIDTDSSNVLSWAQVGNGTSHVAITMNGTTTGGLIYTRFRLVCLSSTLWHVDGINFGNGTVATPFATS